MHLRQVAKQEEFTLILNINESQREENVYRLSIAVLHLSNQQQNLEKRDLTKVKDWTEWQINKDKMKIRFTEDTKVTIRV
jgi:hypothetical protein